MDIQRLRNLTTGKLHTEIPDVYEDLKYITRGGGISTHTMSRVADSIEPWLREKVTDSRFWDGKYDVTHTGDFPLDCMSEEECADALKRFAAMPNPLAGKNIIEVELG